MRKKYLWRHQNGKWYVRVKGKYFRIQAQEGSEAFDREYWEILTGKRHEQKTSWSALIKSYRQSDRWSNLKPRTRQDYERVMVYIEEKVGTRDVRRVTRADVIKAQDANKSRIRFANYIPQVMSVLVEHAIDIGWMQKNPAKGVRALKTHEDKKQEHVPWTDEAVALFREKGSQTARLIFEIAIGTVQRPSDWLKFKWTDYDGQALNVTQGKTGNSLYLPCTDRLKAVLDAQDRSLAYIISRQDGQKMSYRWMADLMRRERKRLGLERYDLHALRYRGVMELAWAGCDDDEISSYSGHASKEMIKKYAGEARQIMRARQAKEKRK